MELKQQVRIAAPRAQVFAALNDPAMLQQAVPGCEALREAAPGQFEATVAAKVGPLSARFTGQMTVSDLDAPRSYTLMGEGKAGPAGHAKVKASVQLEEDGHATLLNYQVKAEVGGKLGQLGGAIIDRTAAKLAGEFFQRFEALLAPGEQREEVSSDQVPATLAALPAKPVTMAAWYFMAAVALLLAGWVLLH